MLLGRGLRLLQALFGREDERKRRDEKRVMRKVQKLATKIMPCSCRVSPGARGKSLLHTGSNTYYQGRRPPYTQVCFGVPNLKNRWRGHVEAKNGSQEVDDDPGINVLDPHKPRDGSRV
jgi:hypothetical protein